METSEEIAVGNSPLPAADTAQWPYELTFDGGARRIGEGDKVSGAAAVLWRHDPRRGYPRVVAVAVVALPG
eukprot:4404468-Pyramimonas_sp.AAC.1